MILKLYWWQSITTHPGKVWWTQLTGWKEAAIFFK